MFHASSSCQFAPLFRLRVLKVALVASVSGIAPAIERMTSFSPTSLFPADPLKIGM